MTSAALILSGGPDSATVLYRLIREGKSPIHALTFFYGQRHSREIQSAENVVAFAREREGVEIVHVQSDLTSIAEMLAGSNCCLIDPAVPVPNGTYDETTLPVTVVPGRNLIFLSLAASYCEARKIPELYYGAHKNDRLVYPDCRPEFINPAQEAILKSTAWSPVLLRAPFQHVSKADIMRQAVSFGVPLHLTWSCYEGGATPCGTCPSCRERAKAFARIGLADPALTGPKG